MPVNVVIIGQSHNYPYQVNWLRKVYIQECLTFFNPIKFEIQTKEALEKNQSTTNTTAKFLDNIYNSINNKNIAIATYIDFSKAFDTVPHDILLKKKKLYGIKNNNNKWIQNYLENRKQKTCLNNAMSDLSTVTVGVPQGSVLGPLLFLVNDLCDMLNTCNSYLYADDTDCVCVTS